MPKHTPKDKKKKTQQSKHQQPCPPGMVRRNGRCVPAQAPKRGSGGSQGGVRY